MLIVGLGNPGRQYEYTRHNIGFMLADAIARFYNFSPYKEKFRGYFAEGLIGNNKTFLLKPITYMNNSGISVRELSNFYKIAPEDIIVIHDDIDLEFGKVRVKKGGGHGGHNGLKSLDSHMGKDYYRLRFGVGRPKDKEDVSDYVLDNFSKSELKDLEDKKYNICRHLPVVLDKYLDQFMNLLHNENM